MPDTRPSRLPRLIAAKAAAKQLRAELAEKDLPITHGKALEKIAHRHGYRNWNVFHAAITQQNPNRLAKGDRIRGAYLSHPFNATILKTETVRPGWQRILIDLDDAVDVVAFASFSNYRKRIQGTIGPAGASQERTSDGQPHLIVYL